MKIEPIRLRAADTFNPQMVKGYNKLNEVIIKVNNHSDILSGLVEEVSTIENYVPCGKCRNKFNMPINFMGKIICEDCDPSMNPTTQEPEKEYGISRELTATESAIAEQAVKADRDRIIEAIEARFPFHPMPHEASPTGYRDRDLEMRVKVERYMKQYIIEIVRNEE